MTTRSRARRVAAMLATLGVAGMAGMSPAYAAYAEIPVTDGGSLTGVVRFVGAAPTRAPVAVLRNRDLCGEQQPSEALAVAPDGGVKGSAVLLEDVTRGKRAAGDVVIESARCAFVPRVAAMMVGGRARVKNADPILHNARGLLGAPTVFNVALPAQGQEIDISRRLTRPGAVRIRCDAHPHMSGWLLVHDSPYVTVTDDRGAYRIDAIPPGTYRVTMWHEGFRRQDVDTAGRPVYEEPRTTTRRVTVVPRATVTLDFELR